MFKEAFLLSLLIHNAFPDCQCGLRTQLARPLIFGGKDAQPGEYPWQAFILKFQDGKAYGCGGFIIKTEWILTAAHCLPALNNQVVQPEILVRVGGVINADWNSVFQPWINYRLYHYPRPDITSLNENDLYLVDRWVPHSEFPKAYSADIALLHVQTPFNFSDTVRPICLELPTAVHRFHPVVELSGWGKTSDWDRIPSHRLQSITISEVKYEDCTVKHEINPLRQMCFSRGRGGCQADSSSPLVYQKGGQFYQRALLSRLLSETCEEKSVGGNRYSCPLLLQLELEDDQQWDLVRSLSHRV